MELFTLGIDLAKTTFHLVGMNQRGCQTTIKVMDAGRDASEQDILPAQFCGDYIKGYAGALIAGKEIFADADVSNGAMVRVYSSYMQQHPEFLKQHQSAGVRAALKFNYSCGKRKRR